MESPFKKDYEITLEAIKCVGSALQFADISFKKDKNFVLKFIEDDPMTLRFVDVSLKALSL